MVKGDLRAIPWVQALAQVDLATGHPQAQVGARIETLSPVFFFAS